MDAATAALGGAGIGALGSLAASYLQGRLQRARESAARRDEAAKELAMARRTEYVRLLTAAREVRYIALRTFQELATRPISEVDTLLTQLSAAYYMIALTAPTDTAALAWTLREDVFDLWRLARDHPESNAWRCEVRKVRATAELFRVHVRTELNLADIHSESRGDEPPSQH